MSAEIRRNVILQGDAWQLAKTLPDESINCIVTSPPYFGLRDYGDSGQFGLESTPEEYVDKLVALFRELRRALRDDGTVWLNLGDSYGRGTRVNNPNDIMRGATGNTGQVTTVQSGGYGGGAVIANKQLLGIPWRVAFALQADGWWLRQDIIWSKKAAMPESVRDRCTKSHEYVFLLTKSPTYWYDAEAIAEPSVDPTATEARYRHTFWETGKHQTGGYSANGTKHTAGMKEFNGTRNRRSVWTLGPEPYKNAHFAVMPSKLVEPCILAGCPPGGVVLDPFLGSGTVAAVARRLGRDWLGFELNAEYTELAWTRIEGAQPPLFEVTA